MAPLSFHLAAIGASALVFGAGAATGFDSVAFLRTYAHFSNDDLARLARGEPVARTLEADNAEAAICAAIEVDVPPAFYLARFRDIESFKAGDTVRQVRRFGSPPAAADLESMRVDDVDDLRACRVGDCAVKLDASGIERVRALNRSSGPAPLADAYRQHLAAYAARYLAEGDAALLEYRDGAKAQTVASELRLILEHSPYLARELPRVAAGIGRFAGSLPSGLEGFLYWSVEDVGPRSVVSITHAVIDAQDPGPVAIATKQIYGSHYFTASLGLTILADLSTPARPRTRVIYINRSRVDAFGGVLGGVKRALARSRARKGADHTLRSLKARLEAASRRTPGR